MEIENRKKKLLLWIFLLDYSCTQLLAQSLTNSEIPVMPDQDLRKATLNRDWTALQQSPHQLGVRDGYMFLLDALDAKFLTDKQVEWALKELLTRVISDSTARSYGNIYWGWSETGGDVGAGNNVQFCVQYGILTTEKRE